MSWGAVIVGVGTVAGAAISASGSSAEGAQPRNLQSETGQINEISRGLTRDQIGLNTEWANTVLGLNDQFRAKQTQNQQVAARNIQGLYLEQAKGERKATRRQREWDLADLTNLGQGYQEQFARNSPGYAAVLDELGKGPTAEDALGSKLTLDATGAGRSPLLAALEAQALGELGLGRNLSGAQEREAAQSARAAWSARGLGASNGAIGAEILNRDAYATQREQQRRQFAAGTGQLLMQEDQLNRQFGLGVMGLNAEREQARRNFTLNAAQVTNAPLNGVLNNRAPGYLLGGTIGAAGLGMSVATPAQVATSGPQLANYLPTTYGYGADVFNTNLNMAESRAIGAQNQANAIGGAVAGAAGQIGGAFLSNLGTSAPNVANAPKASYVSPGTSAQFSRG